VLLILNIKVFKLISKSPLCYRLENPGAKKLYLSAGIHGDETSGPFTLINLLKEPEFFDDLDVTIFPILNMYGHLHNQRHNAADKDLNRDFKHKVEKETKEHLNLMTLDYDIAICLHEGKNADGVYIYKPNKNKRLNVMEEILKAMTLYMPLDDRHKKMHSLIEPGIIRDVKYKEVHETEAVYLANRDVCTFTIEVAHDYPMKEREKTLRAGIKEAVKILTNL